MKIFKRKPTYTKHYLRVYCNIGKSEYSETEKKNLVSSLLVIPNLLFEEPKLEFDIHGPGYEISKGSSIGKKALMNRFEKKGYSKMYAFDVISEEQKFNSGILFMPNSTTLGFLDCHFSWPYSISNPQKFLIELINELSKFAHIEYGYCYPADDRLSDAGEGVVKAGLFSTTVSNPDSEILWRDKIEQIPTGIIKKLYPLNLLNSKQIDQLTNIEPNNSIQLNSNIQLWEIENYDDLTSKVNNSVLK